MLPWPRVAQGGLAIIRVLPSPFRSTRPMSMAGEAVCSDVLMSHSLNLGFPGRRWEVGLENIPATVFGSSLCVRHCIKHVMGITSFNHLRCPPSPTPPPNSYVEANPRHEGMRSWAFGRCGGHGRAVLMNGISALIVRDPTGTLYPVQHAKTQQEVGSLHRPPPSEEAPHQNLTVLDFQPPQVREIDVCCS